MELLLNGVGLGLALMTVLGITGVSHSKLSKKLERIESDIAIKIGEREVRQLVADKIEPHKVTVLNLSAKIEDVREQAHELNRKVDKIIELLYRDFQTNDRPPKK